MKIAQIRQELRANPRIFYGQRTEMSPAIVQSIVHIMSQDPSLTVGNFFKQSDNIPVNQKWDTLWHNKCTPWDRGLSSPALVELLEDKKYPLLPAGKNVGKALVPGCGKGYDVALLASLRGERQRMEKVVGLDVSRLAMEEARRLHAGGDGNMEFVVGDFFPGNEPWAKEGPYDVIYDYTVQFLLGAWGDDSFCVPCIRI